MNYRVIRSPKSELKVRKVSMYLTDKEWEMLQKNNKFISTHFGVKRNQVLIDLLVYNWTPKNLRDMGYIKADDYMKFMKDVAEGKIKLSKQNLKYV